MDRGTLTSPPLNSCDWRLLWNGVGSGPYRTNNNNTNGEPEPWGSGPRAYQDLSELLTCGPWGTHVKTVRSLEIEEVPRAMLGNAANSFGTNRYIYI